MKTANALAALILLFVADAAIAQQAPPPAPPPAPPTWTPPCWFGCGPPPGAPPRMCPVQVCHPFDGDLSHCHIEMRPCGG